MTLSGFCVDTSSLVAAWVERYPPEVFPGLWDKVAELIRSGQLYAPDEVRTELTKRSSEVVDWLDGFDGFFIPTDDAVLVEVTAVLAAFPKLVMERKVAFAADPFVIGLARIKKATVVTEEGAGSVGRPKIPLVCQSYSLSCCNLLELIKSHGWVLG